MLLPQFKKTLIKRNNCLVEQSANQCEGENRILWAEVRAEGLLSFHGLDKNNLELVLNLV